MSEKYIKIFLKKKSRRYWNMSKIIIQHIISNFLGTLYNF